LHIIGKICGGVNFDAPKIFLRYSVKIGDNFTLLKGKSDGETFLSCRHGDFIPLEHPIDLHYIAKAIRGWPKMLIEVWQEDNDGRNTIAGYGLLTFPVASGEFKLDINCWRPKGGFVEKLLGTYPELQYKDIMMCSKSRYGLQTESTGTIKLEVSMILKDFQYHGVVM
jgi:hypothetical protein